MAIFLFAVSERDSGFCVPVDNIHLAKKAKYSCSEKMFTNREIMTADRLSLGTYDMIQIEYVSANQ